MRRLRKLGFSLMVVARLLSSVLLGSVPAWADKPLRVSSDQGFPPYEERDATGKPTGFAVDLLREVAQAELLDLQWQVDPWDPWDRSMRALASGSIDILPMVANSVARDKVFDFSDPVLTSYDAVFVRRDENRVESVDDLKKRNILVMKGGMAHEYLMRTGNYRGLTLATTSEEAMRRFANGEADCLLMSRLPGLLHIRQLAYDNIEALDLKVEGYHRVFSIAVTEGNAALLARLNRGLKTVRESGVYDQLFDHWIASTDKAVIDQRKTLETLYFILFVAALLMLVGAVFLWVLQRIIAEKTRALRAEVDERRKAEKNAVINEQKFRGAFESTMQGMFITTLDGKLAHINQSLCTMLGYTEMELLGMPARKLLHPEYLAHYDQLQSLMMAGELDQYQVEMRLRKKKGAFVWAQSFFSLVNDVDGSPYEIVAQLQDVTQSKADAYKQAQQLYDLNFLRDTLDEHAIVARIDRYGIITDLNAKGCLISGYDWDDVLGKPVDRVFAEEGYKFQTSAIWATLKKGEVWQGEIVRRAKSGDRVFLSTTIAPHQGDDGRQDAYLVVCTDITQQKTVEQKQEQLKARLQQAEKMESIGRLTGGIAHDFNNILASILGFTDLTLSKYGEELNDKAKRYLTEVTSAGERARDLITQMMAFSRTNVGETKSVNASPIVKETLKMLQPTLPSSIQVNAHIPTDQDYTILMDPINMHQIVMNLMINARDAMEGKGLIDVRLQHVNINHRHCASCHQPLKGEYIELSVKDNGEGITPKTLQKIFDPFFTTKDIGAGTGMGLSVVHGIVHEHEGHILVESNEDNGSKFRVLFKPAQPDVILVGENPELIEVKKGSVRILVVDDEPMVGDYLKELFESLGHHVSLFSHSDQAWQSFQDNPMQYDMLVSDQTMPGLLGTELARNVLKVRDDIPVVLCTGYVDDTVKQDIEGLNVTLLRKPIDPRRLLELMPS